MMKKIIIIDGNSFAFGREPREDESEKIAKSAIDQRDIYIVRKFIKKVLKLMFGMFWGYEIVVIFDQQDKFTFRHELSDKYKNKKLSEKRAKQKEYVYKQIEEIKWILKKIGIPYYSTNNWEADDIIGMLSSHLSNKNYLVTIISGDKDILQLITKKIRVAFFNQNSFLKIYDRKILKEEVMGIWPDQIIDVKILCGDKSDNIKGLGIKRKEKDKTLLNYWTEDEATKYIKKYNSIDGMFNNINQIPNPYKKSLLFGKEKIELNKKLVTIVKKWKIDVNPSHFKIQKISPEKIEEVLIDLKLERVFEQPRIKRNFAKMEKK